MQVVSLIRFSAQIFPLFLNLEINCTESSPACTLTAPLSLTTSQAASPSPLLFSMGALQRARHRLSPLPRVSSPPPGPFLLPSPFLYSAYHCLSLFVALSVSSTPAREPQKGGPRIVSLTTVPAALEQLLSPEHS